MAPSLNLFFSLVCVLYLTIVHAELQLSKCRLDPWLSSSPLFSAETYDLEFEPNLKTLELRGSAKILATCTGNLGTRKPTKSEQFKCATANLLCLKDNKPQTRTRRRIVLQIGTVTDIDNIKVFSVTKSGKLGEQLAIESSCIDQKYALLELHLVNKPQKRDKLSLQIDFRSKIDNEIVDLDARVDDYVSPQRALTLFPTINNPDSKSIFKLKLIHDHDLVSASNGEILSEQIDEQTHKKHVEFAQTPPLPAYIFSFLVGRYETSTCQSDGMAKTRVVAHAPVGRGDETKFMLDFVCKAIGQAEIQTGHPFPCPTLNLSSAKRVVGSVWDWGMLPLEENLLFTSDRAPSVDRAHATSLAWHGVLAMAQHWSQSEA